MKRCERCEGLGYVDVARLFSASVQGVIKLCPECKDHIKFHAEIRRRYGLDGDRPEIFDLSSIMGMPQPFVYNPETRMLEPYLPANDDFVARRKLQRSRETMERILNRSLNAFGFSLWSEAEAEFQKEDNVLQFRKQEKS